jgi:fluoride ion exporter CrcB/FEX
MMERRDAPAHDDGALPNGAGAAAVLAAGCGCFILGVMAVAADHASLLKSLLNFYKPTGPLSGVTTCAMVVWLATWTVLDWRWRRRNVAIERVSAIAYVLLGLGVALTFPPIGDLF